MTASASADSPSGADGSLFRRRTLEDIHRQALLLREDAVAITKQFAEARTRMRSVIRNLGRRSPTPDPFELVSPQASSPLEGWLNLAESNLALERETIRSRRLEDEVLAVQDQERDRLSRDLHDGACQELTALGFMLEAHLHQLKVLGANEPALQTVHKIQEMLLRASQHLRSMAHGLSAYEVGEVGEGLGRALATMAEKTSYHAGVRCTFHGEEVPQMGASVATHLYRFAQEAVSNAVRHGRAGHIEVCLVRVGAKWRLTITDDGVGPPAEGFVAGKTGLGLRSMEYRAAVVGGALEMRRVAAAGQQPITVVNCVFG